MVNESSESLGSHCRNAGVVGPVTQLFAQLHLFTEAETPGALGMSSKVSSSKNTESAPG